MVRISMTDKQKCPAGITIVDVDGQPLKSRPEGATITFASTDPSIADFAVDGDGLNGTITSGQVGAATINVSVVLPDGPTLTGSLEVEVTNSLPGSVNFTAGTPVDE